MYEWQPAKEEGGGKGREGKEESRWSEEEEKRMETV